MNCSQQLWADGKQAPKTCADCGLGPCRVRQDNRAPIARARDNFLASEEGVRLQSGATSGQYLRNRLEAAFVAGWNAKERERS
jgi:hypothetical protein